MGKHASDIDKAAFLVHLQYVHKSEAARRAGLKQQTASDLNIRAETLGAVSTRQNKIVSCKNGCN